jgi:uncharacterized protein with NRDE domain
MCIAAVAWNAHPRWRLVVAANRDEFHVRPATLLARWNDGSGIIAGRDLRSGGTWLGVSEAGRFALVTNFRAPEFTRPDRPSRGALITGLLGNANPADVPISEYNPSNVLWAAPDSAMVLSNYPQDIRQPITNGVHGLSNGGFDDSWPKTRQLCSGLSQWLEQDLDDFAPLFGALRDDAAIVGPGPEAKLSGVFINDPEYGTRCSTVLAIDHQGRGVVTERGFDSAGEVSGEATVSFTWSPR